MTSRRKILATTQRIGDIVMLGLAFLLALATTGYLGSNGSLAEFLSIAREAGELLHVHGLRAPLDADLRGVRSVSLEKDQRSL